MAHIWHTCSLLQPNKSLWLAMTLGVDLVQEPLSEPTLGNHWLTTSPERYGLQQNINCVDKHVVLKKWQQNTGKKHKPKYFDKGNHIDL